VSIAECIGGAALSHILHTLAKYVFPFRSLFVVCYFLFISSCFLNCSRVYSGRDYHHSASGLPDLILWDTTAKTCIISEVKGPSDKLSDKQCIWLDVLCKAAKLSSVPNKLQVHVIHVSSKSDIVFDDDDLEIVDRAHRDYDERFMENEKPNSNNINWESDSEEMISNEESNLLREMD
jgi:hypothetical protein